MAAKNNMAIRDDAVSFFILEWTMSSIGDCFERNTLIIIVEARLNKNTI